jgi:flavin reductase (DIM6/NTAB) family NADH-FMN oxidoreductase RutF
MPVKEGPVPPFPPGVDPDEYDRLRRRVLWTMPSGLYVVGSTDGASRRNLMTLNWATQLAFEPKLLGIAVEQAAYTHELIEAGGVFSLCVIDREDRAIVRKFTKPVEVDLAAGTLNVRDRVATGDHTLFVGEIVDCGFPKDEATPVLRMEDTRMNYGG